MSRSRRSRRNRRVRPTPPPPGAPLGAAPRTTAATQPALGATPTRPTTRKRAASLGTPYVSGEIRRVAGVSLASFGLLALLIAVDRLG